MTYRTSSNTEIATRSAYVSYDICRKKHEEDNIHHTELLVLFHAAFTADQRSIISDPVDLFVDKFAGSY